MRRIKGVFLVLLMSVMLCTTCFAGAGEDLVRKIDHESGDETKNVTLAVRDCYKNWAKYIGDNYNNIEFSLMYRLHYLNDGDIFGAYDDLGSFGKNISDKYVWVVPCYEKGGELEVVRNEHAEFGWSVRKGSTFLKIMKFNYPEVFTGIVFMFDNVLDQYPRADTDSFRYVYSDLLNCYLMYFVNDGTEYLVPYFSSKDITWMNNAQIYEADEYIQLARENYNAGLDSTDLSYGAKTSKEFQRIYVLYIVVGSLIVICTAVFAVLTVKKKTKDKNVD